MKRMLRLEALEQRQLMAVDAMPFHNPIVPNDVNADFSISPLDALVIINRLNAQGSGSLSGQAPTDRNSFVDTDNDNTLSPLDVLKVINSVNMGEGVGEEQVQIRYQFFSVNPDGTAGTQLQDPIEDGKADAVIAPGDQVIVRTQMKDIRPTKRGVFSAYHDLSYTNEDGSIDERLLFQWGEYYSLSLGTKTALPPPSTSSVLDAKGGSFTLKLGGIETAEIKLGFVGNTTNYSAVNTALNIQKALNDKFGDNLNSVFVVRALTDNLTSRFGINFIGSKARMNVPEELTVGTNALTGDGGVPISVLQISNNQVDPTLSNVAAAGRIHNLRNDYFDPVINGNVSGVRYTEGQGGDFKPAASATRSIDLLGGFAGSLSIPEEQAADYVNVVDTIFLAGSAGVINFVSKVSPPPAAGTTDDNLGIALYEGRAIYLTEDLVIPATGKLTIADKLTAVQDNLSIIEDSGTSVINVVSNDLNQQGPRSEIQLTGVETISPSIGTVSFNGVNVSFTPAKDYFGPAVFKYTIRNAQLTPATGTVSINVSAVNDPPNIIGTQFTVAEDLPLVITQTTPSQIFNAGPQNEIAPGPNGGQTVTFQQPPQGFNPTNGTVAIDGSGNINFTPNTNFFGNATFTVRGNDGIATTDAIITVTVTPRNDPPEPFNGTLTVPEDGSLVVIGGANDLISRSNPGPGEAGTQSVILVAIPSSTKAPSNGTITQGPAGVWTYRPNANFFGQDTFSYTITDNGTDPAPATVEGLVTINVTSLNDAPVAVNDTGDTGRFVVRGVSIAGLPAVELDVLRNDNAGPLEPNVGLTIIRSSVTTPTNGATATVSDDGTRILFTPQPNVFDVTSTFSYQIQDSEGALSNIANVEVFILPPTLPFAVTDAPTITEDSGAFTINVLDNDFINEPGFTKSLLPFTPITADFGTVVQNGNALVYTPSADYFGPAVFTYRMNDNKDGSVASEGTVRVTVTPVNDAPTAAPRFASTLEDTDLSVLNSVFTTGLSKGPREDGVQTLTVSDVAFAVDGSRSNSTGVLTLNEVTGDFVYKPAKDFNGPVFVRYTVKDNGVNNTTPAPLTASETLTITVNAVNDPPIANPDPARSTRENEPLRITISSLLGNDAAGPANETPPQSVTFVALPSAGIPTANGGRVTQDGGDLIYTPSTSFNGADSFTYQISDGQTTLSTSTGSLTVNVSEVNDAPTAPTPTRSVFASVTTRFDLTAELAAAPKGPANESGQTLRVTRIIPGSVTPGRTVEVIDGSIFYTAPLGANGRDTFQYEVIDNGTTAGGADPKTAIGTFNVDVSPFIPSTVRGIAYVDDDASGSLDAGELRLGGIEVTLTVPATPSTPSRTLVKQTKTDGSYEFGLLPPGAYTVTYAVPLLAIDAPGANSFSRTIVAPGGVTAEYNFAILGVTSRYANLLENLASQFYLADGSLRTTGVYAAVGANGRSEWTITKDGFAGDTFQEVVLSDDGSRAYVTAVRGPNHSVFTATLNRQQFVQVADTTGARLVRVLARSSDLSWQAVSLAAPPVEIASRSKSYLDAVDELFVQENW